MIHFATLSYSSLYSNIYFPGPALLGGGKEASTMEHSRKLTSTQ